MYINLVACIVICSQKTKLLLWASINSNWCNRTQKRTQYAKSPDTVIFQLDDLHRISIAHHSKQILAALKWNVLYVPLRSLLLPVDVYITQWLSICSNWAFFRRTTPTKKPMVLNIASRTIYNLQTKFIFFVKDKSSGN